MLNSPPSTLKIFILHILTLGLYFFYWNSKSRQAINQSAKKALIPTTWILAVPGLNYWWIWEYAHALHHVSFGRIKATDTFLIFVLCTFLPTILFYQLGGFAPDDAKEVSERTAILILLIAVAVFVVVYIIGLAIYCSILQGKINKLKSV